MDRNEILRQNRSVYDAMGAKGDPLCRPAKDSDLTDPLRTVDAAGWLGDSIRGRKLLCLAAGGGRQSALYAAAGADVTVVDLSGAMLELDRLVAVERGYRLRLIEASMDDLSMLQRAEFDIVIHPVSTCYIDCIQNVFREVARVLRPGGVYVSQHKQPVSLQSTTEPSPDGKYAIEHSYYRSAPIPSSSRASSAARRLREPGATEFLHRWEEIIGGMCRAGFVIEDLIEPMHVDAESESGTFSHRALYIAPYVRVKARRKGDLSRQDTSTIWLPH
jgi:ubiquinone/menaquinone biosynthesis C-methylase UbiE